jgi:hypothetical protein
LGSIRNEFQVIFEGGGSTKPHCKEYREFSEAWGFQKTIFELADSKIEKIAEINQQYLADVLTLLTFLTLKQEMEEKEDKFQENLRKAKRGK